MAFSSSFTHCVCCAAVGRRVRILAHVGGLPASAPGTVESMTRPVYPPGVLRFDFAGAGGCLCPGGAPMANNARPGERA